MIYARGVKDLLCNPRYKPASVPRMIARDDDNGTPRSAVILSGRIIYGTASALAGSEPPLLTDGKVSAVYSDTGGATWQRSAAQAVSRVGPDPALCETGIVETPDGLWLLMRAQHDSSLWQSRSTSGGLSWTPPTPLNASGSRIVSVNTPATPLRLRDGRIVLLWCNGLTHNQTYPTRQMLHAAVSDGRSYTFSSGYREIYRSLFPNTNSLGPAGPNVDGADRTDFGAAYPFVIETARDGRLLVATGQGFGTQVVMMVDVDWIAQSHQLADFTAAPPAFPPLPALCDYPPCAFDARGQVADPRDYSGTFVSTFGTHGARRSEAGLMLPAGAAAVWNFPSLSSRGAVAMKFALDAHAAAKACVRVSMLDHFAAPEDTASDDDAPRGCSATICPGAVPGRVLSLSVKWEMAAGVFACTWIAENFAQAAVAVRRDVGGGPFEAALSYLRIRPLPSAAVLVKQLASADK